MSAGPSLYLLAALVASGLYARTLQVGRADALDRVETATDAREATASALEENVGRLAAAAALNEAAHPDKTVAALLAIEGLRRKPSSEAGLAFLRSAPFLAGPRAPFASGQRNVTALAWSPDGRSLALGNDDGTISVVDRETGRERHSFQVFGIPVVGGVEGEAVSALAWSPDGAHLAARARGWIQVLDPATGAVRWERTLQRFGALAWAPDGRLLASVAGREVVLSKPATGEVVRAFQWPQGDLLDVAWSPDSTTLVTGGWDGTVGVWDVASGILGKTVESGLPDFFAVTGVAWQPKGTGIAVGYAAGSSLRISVWNSVTWTLDAVLNRADGLLDGAEHEGWIGFPIIEWSADGRLLSAVTRRGVTVWDAVFWTTQAVMSGPREAAWNPVRSELALLGDDALELWRGDARPLARPLAGHTGIVSSVAWDRSGGRLASAGDDGVRIWDARTETLMETLDGHELPATSVVWSPDDTQVASGSFDGTVRVWDVASANAQAVLRPYRGGVVDLAWNQAGDLAVSTIGDFFVLWRGWLSVDPDVLARQLPPQFVGSDLTRVHETAAAWAPGDLSRFVVARWSHDDGRLVGADNAGSVYVLDARLRRDVWNSHQEEDPQRGGSAFAWSPDGRFIASVSRSDNNVLIRHAGDGQTARVIVAGIDPVHSVAWNPQVDELAAGSEDGRIRVWNPTTGELLRTLEGHRSVVTALDWSPDGRQLASAGADGTVRIWDPWDVLIARACERALTRNLTRSEWLHHFGSLVPYSPTCPNLPVPQDK